MKKKIAIIVLWFGLFTILSMLDKTGFLDSVQNGANMAWLAVIVTFCMDYKKSTSTP